MTGNNQRLVKKYHSNWRYVSRKLIQSGSLAKWLQKNFAISVKGRGNLDKLPANGAFIIVANHQSHLDAPLIIGMLPRKIGARVAVGAASDYFFKNYWQSKPTRLLLNTYPIDRGSSKTHQGLTADLVTSGVPILVFPEGTRSRTGELGKFHSGLARIAISTGAPILPIALTGTGQAWMVDRRQPEPSRPSVSIEFLPLVYPLSDSQPEELMESVRQQIANKIGQ